MGVSEFLERILLCEDSGCEVKADGKVMGIIGCWFIIGVTVCLCIYYRKGKVFPTFQSSERSSGALQGLMLTGFACTNGAWSLWSSARMG